MDTFELIVVILLGLFAVLVAGTVIHGIRKRSKMSGLSSFREGLEKIREHGRACHIRIADNKIEYYRVDIISVGKDFVEIQRENFPSSELIPFSVIVSIVVPSLKS